MSSVNPNEISSSLEDYLEDRDKSSKGEDVQCCREDVEYHRQSKVFLVWRDEAS